VRTLASRTQQSTTEIQSMIERLQEGARDAVSVMDSGREKAQTSVDRAESAGGSLQEITRAVASINDMNAQIAGAAEQQSTATEEISRNVTDISSHASRTAEVAGETAQAGSELAELARELNQIVGNFRV